MLAAIWIYCYNRRRGNGSSGRFLHDPDLEVYSRLGSGLPSAKPSPEMVAKKSGGSERIDGDSVMTPVELPSEMFKRSLDIEPLPTTAESHH
jgi:hypothetical protein